MCSEGQLNMGKMVINDENAWRGGDIIKTRRMIWIEKIFFLITKKKKFGFILSLYNGCCDMPRIQTLNLNVYSVFTLIFFSSNSIIGQTEARKF